MGKDKIQLKYENIKNALEKLIKSSLIFQKAAAVKKDGTIYASIGFGRNEDVGNFSIVISRLFKNNKADLEKIGIIFDSLTLPKGLVIIPIGTTALLAVIMDSDLYHGIVADGINRKINKAAMLIKEILETR